MVLKGCFGRAQIGKDVYYCRTVMDVNLYGDEDSEIMMCVCMERFQINTSHISNYVEDSAGRRHRALAAPAWISPKWF